MNIKRFIPAPLRSRLERFAGTLRTAIRDRRALERDLDAAWATHDDLRNLLKQSETRRAELLLERDELRTKQLGTQAELQAALTELHTLKITRKTA